MTKAETAEAVEAFAHAARNAMEAGKFISCSPGLQKPSTGMSMEGSHSLASNAFG